MVQVLFWFRANRTNLAAIYGENSADFYRAVFLSNLGRSLAVMLVVVNLVMTFPGTGFLDSATTLRLLPSIALLVGMLIYSAWLVENGKHAASRYITNAAISLGTIFSVVLCGGFLNSHATPYLIAPIVVAFCTSPPIEAKIVGSITFFLPLVFDGFVKWFGWEIVDYTSLSSSTANTLFLYITLFITIFISLKFLQKTNHELHVALDHDNEILREWATIDPLTKIGNRRMFNTWLEAAQENAVSSNSKFDLIFMDLNAFKPINDEFGHELGDKVLKVVASRLQEVSEGSGNVARLGGDEFAFVPHETFCQTFTKYLTHEIHSIVERPITIDGHDHKVSITIGKAVFPDDATTTSELMHMADMDMYATKMSDKLKKASKETAPKRDTENRAA